MKLEQQVCSLELATKLKELGVKQESYFVWHGDGSEENPWKVFIRSQTGSNIPAFTVAELGEMLPRVVTKDEKLYLLTPSAGGNGLRFIDYVTYHNGVGTFLAAYPYIEGDTEADARAKMLIYLIENNLIEV